MSKKYVRFGAGWRRETKDNGTEFTTVSTVSKDEDAYMDYNPKTKQKTKVKMWLQIEGENEPRQVTNFTIFPNEIDHEKYPSAPNFNVTAVFEE